MANAAHEQLREENELLRVAIAEAIQHLTLSGSSQRAERAAADLLEIVPDWRDILNCKSSEETVLDKLNERMKAKIHELEQTLLNEQGKGEPPSPDWVWHGAYWSHKHKNIIVSLYRQGDVVSWETIINGVAIDDLSDTARAAMRAAEGK